jgi:hypothetical protein
MTIVRSEPSNLDRTTERRQESHSEDESGGGVVGERERERTGKKMSSWWCKCAEGGEASTTTWTALAVPGSGLLTRGALWGYGHGSNAGPMCTDGRSSR